THFLREYLEAEARVHLTDHVYLLGSGAGWRFTSPGVSDLNRRDGAAGLEVDWARWIQTTIRGQIFDYDNRREFGGGDFSTKISPMTGLDLYANASYNQPFISSISTVEHGLRQHSVGFGMDAKLI